MTLAELPQNEWPAFLDGRDLSADWKQQKSHPSEVINIEFWGSAVPEGALRIPNATRNTYKTLRLIGEDYGYLYSRWCTNETDFYDTVVCFLPCFLGAKVVK